MQGHKYLPGLLFIGKANTGQCLAPLAEYADKSVISKVMFFCIHGVNGDIWLFPVGIEAGRFSGSGHGMPLVTDAATIQNQGV